MKEKGAPDINDTLRTEGTGAVRNRHDRSRKYVGGNGGDSNFGARTVIELQRGNLHEVVTKAEAALIAAGTRFYARGGEIVRPIIEEAAAFKGRRTKVARLRSVTVDMMRDYLSRAVQFEKYNPRTKKLVAVDPPHDVAKTILARDGDWRFLPLVGIISTPTLRPDGSVLSKPGYDPATRLLLIEPPPMPTIPECPSREDALAGVTLLDALLEDFPFVNAPSRSVALSALMTPVARGAMQVAPLHGFDAPEAGTGKSYLIDIASCIATGDIAPVIAAGRDEAETEKRLAAELMTGQPIVSIDNLNGDLGGDFVCQAIERRIVKPRVLGRSETKRIENTVCMFGNGNNFRLVGDLVRRVVRCSLDADMERPELRQFRGDPVAAVLADRGRYIIVRAYLAAGCPGVLKPLASFEDWSRLVRSSLVWLRYADPVETMEAARADDPSRNSLRAVVAAWRTVIGPDKPMTASEPRDTACSTANDPDLMLNKAISAVACAPGRSEIDVMRLGRWLGRNKGRVVDGYKSSASRTATVSRWSGSLERREKRKDDTRITWNTHVKGNWRSKPHEFLVNDFIHPNVDPTRWL
jgi:putative DNA primase/helicase